MPGTLSLAVARVVEDVARESFLSQKALGHAAGIDQSKISRAYRGRQAFTIDQLDAICKVLGVSVAAVIAEAQARIVKGE